MQLLIITFVYVLGQSVYKDTKNKPNRLTSQNSLLSNYWIYLNANIPNLNITPCVDQCINVKQGINHYLEVMNLQ